MIRLQLVQDVRDSVVPPYATIPFEFAFIEEFACHSAACRPPGKNGGTGGSLPHDALAVAGAAVRMSSDDLSTLCPGYRHQQDDGEAGGSWLGANSDGTLKLPGVHEGGEFGQYSSETEEKNAALWRSRGITPEQCVQNFVNAGKAAIGINLETGEINQEMLQEGLKKAKWYSNEHESLRALAEETGFFDPHAPKTPKSVEGLSRIVAATAVVSGNRVWTGAINGNKEVVTRLAHLVAHPVTLELTSEHIALMNWKREKATKGVGKVGLDTSKLKPGKINSNDLDSATLAEVLYATNALRGGQTLDHWLSKKSAEDKGDWPLFIKTGTDPIKKAIAVLRGEVSPDVALNQPKTRSFYNNLMYPDSDYSCTNDTWHYRLMALNSELTYQYKGRTYTGTIDELTTAKSAVYNSTDVTPEGQPPTRHTAGTVPPKQVLMFSAQDLFQQGPQAKRENLPGMFTMFRDVTRFTRTALRQLQRDPQTRDIFKGMKIHEFQALIWVQFGGAQLSDKERTRRWNSVRDQARRIGQ